MLDAAADGKRLRLQQNRPVRQKSIDVAGRMTAGQDQGVAKNLLAALAAYPVKASVTDQKIDDFRLEVHFAAGPDDGAADGFDDVGQQIRADVRMGIGENAGGGTVGDEDFVHLGDRSAFGGAGVELAIGKRTRPSFPKTVVALLNNLPLPQQWTQIESAGTHVLAPL